MAIDSAGTRSASSAEELSHLIKAFSDASGSFEGNLILLIGVVRSEPYQLDHADWEPETGYQEVVLGGPLASMQLVYRSEPPISLVVMPKATNGEALETFRMLANRAGQFLQRHGRQKDGSPLPGSEPTADWVRLLVSELWKTQYVVNLPDDRIRITHPFAASTYLFRHLCEARSADKDASSTFGLQTHLMLFQSPAGGAGDAGQGTVTKLDVIRAILLTHHFEDAEFKSESQFLSLDELERKLRDADRHDRLTGKSASQLSRDLKEIIPPDGQTTYKSLLQSPTGQATLLRMIEPDELKRTFGTTDKLDSRAKHERPPLCDPRLK